MTNKFNRKYREYLPTSSGPPTSRICKPIKCEDKDSNTNPTPPPPEGPTYEEELLELKMWLVNCIQQCTGSQFCIDNCKTMYDEKLEELNDKHGKP